MATIDNQVPYKIYEAANAASTDAHVFLGKASIAGINGAKVNYYPHLAEETCYTTFVFASIVSGKNVKVEPATEDDPYIYIDSRWYDFRPCGVETADPTSWPANSIISSVDYSDTGDIQVNFKNLTTDGSIVLEIGNSFVWSDQGPQGINDGSCAIKMSTHKYYASNCPSTTGGVGLLKETIGVPGASDVEFVFKKLTAGNGISLTDTGELIVINLDLANYVP